MTLVVVAAPDSESDLALIACVLEANDIPHFVQGGGFGGLFPGPQISGYNSRRVMVPASCVERAVELLSELNLVGPVPVPTTPAPTPAPPAGVASEQAPSNTTSWFNAGTSLAAGAICAYLWYLNREAWFAVLAASFFLRAPVSYRHPMTWANLNRPFAARPEPRATFTTSDALLSIASFLLLLVAIGMYAATIF